MLATKRQQEFWTGTEDPEVQGHYINLLGAISNALDTVYRPEASACRERAKEVASKRARQLEEALHVFLDSLPDSTWLGPDEDEDSFVHLRRPSLPAYNQELYN